MTMHAAAPAVVRRGGTQLARSRQVKSCVGRQECGLEIMVLVVTLGLGLTLLVLAVCS